MSAPAVFESSERGADPRPRHPDDRATRSASLARRGRPQARLRQGRAMELAMTRSCTQSLSGFEAREPAASKIARRCRRMQVRRACNLRYLRAIFVSGLNILRQLATTATTTRTEGTRSTSRPASKASTGTRNGAGNDPLMHPVLELIRSTRIGGFEECTKVAKNAGSLRVHSSLPSCILRERPQCIATTRYDRHNPEDRRNPLDRPSVNRFQTITR